MPKKKTRPTTDAVKILHRRYYEGKPERLAGLERARADNQVAREIVALRTHAGLSQRQLAQLSAPPHRLFAVSKTPITKGIPW